MKDALIVMGMGGPDKPADIRPFLKNVFSDRMLMNFGIGNTLQNILASFIALGRTPKAIKRYGLMGGGSPQMGHTTALMDKIRTCYLRKMGRDLDTFAGMCYWRPYIEDAVARVAVGAYRNIYFLPMYPQFSMSTSGVCFRKANNAMANNPPDGRIVSIPHYFEYESYLEVLVVKIEDAAAKLGKSPRECHLLFSAHSLPASILEKGDPYVRQLEAQASKIVSMIPGESYSLCFQSKAGWVKWLEPDIESELKRLNENKITDIIVVALSFVNDHIETLVELDSEILPVWRAKGMNIMRAGMPNGDDSFAEAMTQLITGSM